MLKWDRKATKQERMRMSEKQDGSPLKSYIQQNPFYVVPILKVFLQIYVSIYVYVYLPLNV